MPKLFKKLIRKAVMASSVSTVTSYKHLEPRPGSNYRQLFLKNRRIRAAVVYETIHGPDPCTAEKFAEEFHVPLEAVEEALDYVNHNLTLIQEEREREAADIRMRGLDRTPWSEPSRSPLP